MKKPRQKPVDLADQHIEKIRIAARLACHRYRVPHSDREDVFHHAFIEAIRAATLYLDGRSNSASFWIYARRRVQFAVSVFIRTRHLEFSKRQIKRRIEFQPLEDHAAIEPLAVIDEADLLIDRICIGRADRAREILKAKFVEGLNNHEIAARFDSTPRSIGQTIYMIFQDVRQAAAENPASGFAITGR